MPRLKTPGIRHGKATGPDGLFVLDGDGRPIPVRLIVLRGGPADGHELRMHRDYGRLELPVAGIAYAATGVMEGPREVFALEAKPEPCPA